MNFVKKCESFLNSITMYRLALYGLGSLALVSVVLGFLGRLPFSGVAFLGSLAVFVGGCLGMNLLFARIYRVPSNTESSFITALILFFLIAPPSGKDAGVSFLGTALAACAFAMASKYLLAFRKRHLFNPAAFAAVLLGALGNPDVVWWVASQPLVPLTVIVGWLVVKKVRRFLLVGSFLGAWIVVTVVTALVFFKLSPIHLIAQGIVSWPVFFFAAFMLTEPLTSPATQPMRAVFGALVGVLFAVPFHVGPFFSTPELALVMGNLFAYLVSGNRRRFTLRLIEKRELAPEIFEFIFEPDARILFQAGQYVEWTLPHPNPDSRGIRRYFTIASSPQERALRFGVRIGRSVSSFKTALQSLPIGGVVYASHLMGDFVLPRDPRQKLLFIAGGIGITPFRSMIHDLMDSGEKRDIVLLYTCVSSRDFVYRDVFERARRSFGLKTVHIVTDANQCEPGFPCRIGYVDDKLLAEEVPDFRERLCYLSGPVAMVKAYKQLLQSLSIPVRNIITDYFPGF